jgi:hypothetical protein
MLIKASLVFVVVVQLHEDVLPERGQVQAAA